MQAPRPLASLAVVVGIALGSCGPKGNGSEFRLPPAAADYAALRWVPADATYALMTRRTEDAVLVLRDLADSLGLLDGEDAASIGAALARELGFDPLQATALAEQGFDLDRGLALWSRGIGPTAAIPLADPARVAALIADYRSHGARVQVATAHGLEVYTWQPERELALRWTIVDDWLLVHLAFAEEREADGAWLDAALAARGGFALHDDFAAARVAGEQRVGTPGLLAVVRMPAVFATPIGPALRGCRDTLGKVGRVLVSASTDGVDARGALVAELPGGVDGLRAMQLPRPTGWERGRDGAPLQVEVGVDLREVRALWATCLELGELAREPVEEGFWGGRAYAHQLDLDALTGRGAAAVAGDRRTFQELIDDSGVPGFMRRSRTIAGVSVTEVKVPLAPYVAWAFLDGAAVATVEQPIEPLLALEAPGDELARVEVHPQAWDEGVWSDLLGRAIGRDHLRARTVRALRRWSLGSVVARLDGRALVIDLHGHR